MYEILLFCLVLSVLTGIWYFWHKPAKPAGTTEQNIRDLQQIEGHFKTIDHWVRDDQKYKDSNIKLETVAKATHLTDKQVSVAVNMISCQNFSSYINKLRIQEAHSMLLNPKFDHYTIEALAEMVGFANKVSFYKAFKKVYGQSPAELKKAQNH